MAFSLQDAINLTNKTYKSITAASLADVNAFEGTQYRRSGCIAFDWMLANHSKDGGLARGRIIEIYGPEGSGKTTLATMCAASVQKYKTANKVLFIDYEHKYDVAYAIALGVQRDKLYFSQPTGESSGPAGLQLLLNASKAEDTGLIIVDSVPAVVSKEEESGELTDANIGAQARLWSKTIRQLSNNLGPMSPTVILINQIRDNIGVMFGPKEKTAGARAIRFFACTRVDIRAKGKNEDEDEVVTSQNVQIKIIKNGTGQNFQSTETTLTFGEGYNNEEWLIEKAIELGVGKKKGGKIELAIHPGQAFPKDEWIDNILSRDNGLELKRLYELCIDAQNLKSGRNLEEEPENSKAPASEPVVDLNGIKF